MTKHEELLQPLMSSADLSCLVLNIDAVGSKKKAIKHLATTLPEDELLLWIKCLQHSFALIIFAIVLQLSIVGHLYCAARILRRGDDLSQIEKALTAIILQELDVVEAPAPEDHVCKVRYLVGLTVLRRPGE